MTYTDWSQPDAERRLTIAVANNKAIAGVLKELGLVAAGGNYKNIKYHIWRLSLDTSHFTGQGWNKDHTTTPNQTSRRATAKRYLIINRGHKCENCGLAIWQDKPIPLELEHIDGNNNNNELSNILLLCCNCHALTPTWRRQK